MQETDDFFPFKLPVSELGTLPKFYQDYLLKVSGEVDIKNVKVEDANGLFQMILDSESVTSTGEYELDKAA